MGRGNNRFFGYSEDCGDGVSWSFVEENEEVVMKGAIKEGVCIYKLLWGNVRGLNDEMEIVRLDRLE